VNPLTVTPSDVLVGLQIVATLLGFGGIAFSLGRLYGRIDSVARIQQEMKEAMFGGEEQGGVFLRRAEGRLMMENANREHEAFDRRLGEFHERLGVLEQRGAS